MADDNADMTAPGGLQFTTPPVEQNQGDGAGAPPESMQGDGEQAQAGEFYDELPPDDPNGLIDETAPDPVARRSLERAIAYPGETVASTLIFIGHLLNEYKRLGAAVALHLRSGTVAAQPELHTFLAQVEARAGEFVHAIESLEGGQSDELRAAIIEGVSQFSNPAA